MINRVSVVTADGAKVMVLNADVDVDTMQDIHLVEVLKAAVLSQCDKHDLTVTAGKYNIRITASIVERTDE